ncbi:MAG: glycosyltransferase [Ruminococcus sp.]|nr:glycosyltransferase [Ruminococcus sp.]
MKKALIISCFDWYEKRICAVRECLMSKGYSVMVLTSDYDHINKTYRKTINDECTYIHVPAYKKNLSVQRIISHLSFGRGVGKALKTVKPDLIYLLFPPNNSGEYCLRYIKAHPEVKYIVDIIDMWPETMPLDRLRGLPMIKAWKNMRNRSIRRADHVFLECSLYYRDIYRYVRDKSRVKTLYLFKKEPSNVGFQAKKKDHFEKRISIGYVGSINNIIDIDKICGITRSLFDKGYAVEYDIIGDGENKDSFLERLKSVGAVVRYYGKTFDEKVKFSVLSNCDFGMNIMKDTVEVGLSIKSIDYLSYGLPIINNIKGDTSKIVEKYNIGVNVSNAENTADEIIEYYHSCTEETAERVRKVYKAYFTESAFVKRLDVVLTSLGI